MPENVYPNGMPHPPASLRMRVAIELGVLAVLTALFLWFFPHGANTQGIYLGMAIVGLGLVGFTVKETEERIWGPVGSPSFDRVRRCTINMSALTIPPVIVFLIAGGIARYFKLGWLSHPDTCSMLSLHFFIAMCAYLPWALLQQTLFQFYLLGRLRALLPWATPFQLSVLNGIVYGLCHLPSVEITAVTILGGIGWSYSYHRDRYVLPIAISHAILASTFFYWVCGRDIVAQWIAK